MKRQQSQFNRKGTAMKTHIENGKVVFAEPKTARQAKNPNKSYACEDCEYYTNHRCKLWEVTVSEPDDSHCESLQIS